MWLGPWATAQGNLGCSIGSTVHGEASGEVVCVASGIAAHISEGNRRAPGRCGGRFSLALLVRSLPEMAFLFRTAIRLFIPHSDKR
jgi:hypothetical protein